MLLKVWNATLISLFLCFSLRAQQPAGAPQPFYPIPSPAQLAWQKNNLAIIIKVNPAYLDLCDPQQWAAVAKENGFHRLVLEVKNRQDIQANAEWKEWKNLINKFSKSCISSGLLTGFHLAAPENLSKLDHNQYISQLKELLISCPGPVNEIRLYGAGGEESISAKSDFQNNPQQQQTIISAIRKLQPSAIIVSNVGPDARWNGNHAGHVGEPNWGGFDPSTVPGMVIADRKLVNTLNFGVPGAKYWIPSEGYVKMRPSWNWSSAEDSLVMPLNIILNTYFKCTGRNSVLMFSVPVNSEGKIPLAEKQAFEKMQTALKAIYKTDLATGKTISASNIRHKSPDFKPQNLVDENTNNYWAADDSVKQAFIELDLGGDKEFNLIELQEELSLGQRIENFQIEAFDTSTGTWKNIVKGKTIGFRKADRFAKLSASKLRFTVSSTLASPILKSIHIYYNPY